jgi:hypothetical protein
MKLPHSFGRGNVNIAIYGPINPISMHVLKPFFDKICRSCPNVLNGAQIIFRCPKCPLMVIVMMSCLDHFIYTWIRSLQIMVPQLSL